MTHSTTLITAITERAFKKHGYQTDYVEAKKLWLEEAKVWRAELEAEGLTKTVEQVNKAIAFVEKG